MVKAHLINSVDHEHRVREHGLGDLDVMAWSNTAAADGMVETSNDGASSHSAWSQTAAPTFAPDSSVAGSGGIGGGSSVTSSHASGSATSITSNGDIPLAVTVADGGSAEISGAEAQSVTFAGPTGTLKIDHSLGYTGQVSGLTGSDALDLADVGYGANTAATFSGNASGGVLTVTDGAHSAHIALTGDYLKSGWTLSSDGHGGTMVVDPPLTSVYPNATNTGVPAGTALKASGGLTLSTAGQVISGLVIDGSVDITASNVTLENCIIYAGSAAANWVVSVAGGLSGVVIKNCEIIGPGLSATTQTAGIYVKGDSQVTIDSCNIHEVGHGIDVSGGPVVIENSYIHDLNAASSSHYDAVYFGGDDNPNFSLHIQNNTFINQNTQTSAIFTENFFGPVQNITVNNNLLVGGGYTVYSVSNAQVIENGSGGAVSNISYTNNDIGSGVYGTQDFYGPYSPTWTGNVNDGAALAAALPAAPVVSQASAAAGSYAAGNTITLTLYTSEAVKVSGTPTLTLNDGGTATYKGGSGTNALTFTYTVASGQSTSALAVTGFNGTITDYDGHKLSASSLPATFTGVAIGSGGGGSSGSSPPAAPVIKSFSPDTGVAGDGITNSSTLDLAGTAAANSTVTVYDNGSKIGTTIADSTGSWDYITAVLTNAKHILTATDTVSGQTSAASAALTVTVDTAAPAAPVLTGDTVNASNQAVVAGTAEANSTITVYDGTKVVGTGTTGSNGTFSVTTSALATGTHVLTATATDAAGNTSAASQAMDPVVGSGSGSGSGSTSTPPAAPQIASLTTDSGVTGDHITNDSTPTLAGTAAAGSTVKVFDGKTQVGSATADSSGHWTVTTTTLSDGTHNLTATDTNSSGTSAASTAFAVTIDTHAPAAPVLTGDTVNTANQAVVAGTAEANSTITVYDGTKAVGTGTAGSNGSFSVTTSALSAGTHVLTATATDAAGNISAASQALDPVVGSGSKPTPPAAPQITSLTTDTGVAGDHITDDNTPTLAGIALANSMVKLFDGTTQVGTATADSSGHWSATTTTLSDGTHNLTATDTNSSGTSTASTAFAVTIDTHVPAAPTMAVYSEGGASVGATTTLGDLVLKGTAEAHSTVDVFDGGKQIGTAATNSSGGWSFDTGQLANGKHSFTAAAVDVAGNTGHASAADVVSVTASAPSTSTPGHAPIEFTGVTFANHIATITGTADAYSQIKLLDGNTSIGTVTASANGTWSLTASQLSDTLHTITASELDSTGHVVETSSGKVFLPGSNTSTLNATGGDDFLFSSSSHVNDTFVFASNFGHSIIEGFSVSGPGQDTVQFSKSVFDSFASVLSHASQVGNDVVIASGSNTLTMLNTKLSALHNSDFHFA